MNLLNNNFISIFYSVTPIATYQPVLITPQNAIIFYQTIQYVALPIIGFFYLPKTAKHPSLIMHMDVDTLNHTLTFLDKRTLATLRCVAKRFCSSKQLVKQLLKNDENKWIRNGIQQAIAKRTDIVFSQAVKDYLSRTVTLLNLSKMNLSASILKNIASLCPNIKSLWLDHTTLATEKVKALQSFSKLKYLSLKECITAEESLTHLSGIALKELDIAGIVDQLPTNPIVGEKLFCSLPSTLRKLKADSLHTLTNQAIRNLQHTQLEELAIPITKKLTGVSTFRYLPKTLRILELSGLDKTEAQAYRELAHTNLAKLKLKGLTIEATTSFSELPATIKIIEFKWCDSAEITRTSIINKNIELIIR